MLPQYLPPHRQARIMDMLEAELNTPAIPGKPTTASQTSKEQTHTLLRTAASKNLHYCAAALEAHVSTSTARRFYIKHGFPTKPTKNP